MYIGGECDPRSGTTGLYLKRKKGACNELGAAWTYDMVLRAFSSRSWGKRTFMCVSLWGRGPNHLPCTIQHPPVSACGVTFVQLCCKSGK